MEIKKDGYSLFIPVWICNHFHGMTSKKELYIEINLEDYSWK